VFCRLRKLGLVLLRAGKDIVVLTVGVVEEGVHVGVQRGGAVPVGVLRQHHRLTHARVVARDERVPDVRQNESLVVQKRHLSGFLR